MICRCVLVCCTLRLCLSLMFVTVCVVFESVEGVCVLVFVCVGVLVGVWVGVLSLCSCSV